MSPSRKARGYRVKENNLTIEFLVELWDRQKGRCPISGLELMTISGDPCSASIDRINSELGYLQDNVILDCKWVNLGRGRYPITEFKALLRRINLT